jgi:hypothetical protein
MTTAAFKLLQNSTLSVAAVAASGPRRKPLLLYNTQKPQTEMVPLAFLQQSAMVQLP